MATATEAAAVAGSDLLSTCSSMPFSSPVSSFAPAPVSAIAQTATPVCHGSVTGISGTNSAAFSSTDKRNVRPRKRAHGNAGAAAGRAEDPQHGHSLSATEAGAAPASSSSSAHTAAGTQEAAQSPCDQKDKPQPEEDVVDGRKFKRRRENAGGQGGGGGSDDAVVEPAPAVVSATASASAPGGAGPGGRGRSTAGGGCNGRGRINGRGRGRVKGGRSAGSGLPKVTVENDYSRPRLHHRAPPAAPSASSGQGGGGGGAAVIAGANAAPVRRSKRNVSLSLLEMDVQRRESAENTCRQVSWGGECTSVWSCLFLDVHFVGRCLVFHCLSMFLLPSFAILNCAVVMFVCVHKLGDRAQRSMVNDFGFLRVVQCVCDLAPRNVMFTAGVSPAPPALCAAPTMMSRHLFLLGRVNARYTRPRSRGRRQSGRANHGDRWMWRSIAGPPARWRQQDGWGGDRGKQRWCRRRGEEWRQDAASPTKVDGFGERTKGDTAPGCGVPDDGGRGGASAASHACAKHRRDENARSGGINLTASMPCYFPLCVVLCCVVWVARVL